jgi:hypothetical protein
MAVKVQHLTWLRGDTYAINVSIKNCIEELTEIYFTVKQNYDDKNVVMQKTLSGGAITELHGTETKARYNILIHATDTDKMKVDTEYLYDLELVADTLKKTILKGTITLEADVTRTENERC